MSGKLHVLSLPDPLLEQILQPFTTKERARTIPLVCCQLRDLCRTSKVVWSRLIIDPKALQSRASAYAWCRCAPLQIQPCILEEILLASLFTDA